MLPETVVRPRKLVIEDENIIIVNIVFNLKERDFMEKKTIDVFCLPLPEHRNGAGTNKSYRYRSQQRRQRACNWCVC